MNSFFIFNVFMTMFAFVNMCMVIRMPHAPEWGKVLLVVLFMVSAAATAYSYNL